MDSCVGSGDCGGVLEQDEISKTVLALSRGASTRLHQTPVLSLYFRTTVLAYLKIERLHQFCLISWRSRPFKIIVDIKLFYLFLCFEEPINAIIRKYLHLNEPKFTETLHLIEKMDKNYFVFLF